MADLFSPMLDLSKYPSIGAALKDALDRFAAEVCLIEADREREKERLTYRDFKSRAHQLAKAFEDAGWCRSTISSRPMNSGSSSNILALRCWLPNILSGGNSGPPGDAHRRTCKPFL